MDHETGDDTAYGTDEDMAYAADLATDVVDGADLAQLLDDVIAEAGGDMDHLAMWAEELQEADDEAAQASVLGALAQDPAVPQQPADAAGPAAQAMVAFLQAALALPAPGTESPEDSKVRSRAEGLSAADARELFP